MSNLTAFFDALAYSEGTDNGVQPTHDRGYDVLVGGKLFQNYADHPRVYNAKLNSTAAGRYQILDDIFDAYKERLKLPDFSPASQDKIALQLIKECKALININLGNFDIAIHQCRSRWASLPGAGYGQHEQKIEALRKVYVKAGGKVGSA